MHSHDKHIEAVCKMMQSFAFRHDLHNLFSDCIEAAAIALSNSVDLVSRDAREKRYLEIVGRYERDVVDMFPNVLGEVVLALDVEPGDVLGAIYSELGLQSAARGQYFTPYSVCRLSAEVMVGKGEQINEIILRHGFVCAQEPTCGAGAMIVALAEALRARGINYQQHLHVTAIDIDPRAVHMAYIQLTLMHIPAVVIVGNSLSMEMREYWYTPAHILGRWSGKLILRGAEEAALALINPPAEPSTSTEPPAQSEGRERRQLRLF